ncbi:hypothetical protein Bca52824_048071 [Brassica carinata]|uniref:C2H2-type domain-containing protein n=1 Tax=Brassica carinata TaxID=52824 RepID=A0A8X7URU5_BRACI|nr:hypothetical protein Bca52824_048071 [Brassica carinata]
MCFPGLMVKMVKTVTVRRLGRRVRGMMYYRKALELQAFLDMAKDEAKTPQRAESHPGLSVKSLLVLSEPQRGKPVLLVSLLERAAEVVKNSNDGLWRASFDEFFTLLTKYCRSKYETIHGQNQENAAAEVECGKGFTSSKALCGHMACHFEREKRVSCSHFFQVKKSAKSSVISHQSSVISHGLM